MITKNDVVNMARHIVRKDKGKTDRSLMHPQREWNISILIGGIMLIIGITYSSSSFLHYRSILNDESVAEIKTANYREQLVDQVISYYGAKKDSYDHLFNSVVSKSTPVENTESGTATSTATSTIDVGIEILEEEEVATEEETIPDLITG
ncbi:hypothetical protein KC723_00275 [Candidatus Kaiserbacteria bacterium]|nr:hypothetical protein [Candidatus Kaiserbacteria bacterium]